MSQAGTESRVIWRHPRGRFDVVEHRGASPLGPPYRIREAVLTPERDERGIAHKEEPPKPDRSTWKSTARKHSYTRIGPKEAAMIADMYQAGYSCNRIAQELGRDHTSIGEFIRRNHIRKSRPRNGSSENGKQLYTPL